MIRATAWAILLLLTALLPPTAALAQAVTTDLRAATGVSIGAVTFTQAAQDVQVQVAFRNRTALVGTHPVQIRSAGRCDAPAFATSGSQVIGLPSLVIGPAGVGVYNLTAPGTKVDALLGRSLVILDQPDGSTAVACGVIGGGQPGSDRPDLLTSMAIGLTGVLLFVGGVLLRRGA